MGNYDYSVRTQRGVNKPYNGYASVEVTVSGSAVDYSLSHTALFTKLDSANETLIRNGSEPVSIKFNSVSNDSISLVANDFFQVAGLIVTDIFVTVSGGSPALLNVFTLGWK